MRCAREGCDASLDGLRSDARYCSSACKSAAWRARSGYELQARRKACQTRIQRAARPSDVRPTFTRVYEVLVRELGSPLRARDLAEQMLTDKQRARVRELGL